MGNNRTGSGGGARRAIAALAWLVGSTLASCGGSSGKPQNNATVPDGAADRAAGSDAPIDAPRVDGLASDDTSGTGGGGGSTGNGGTDGDVGTGGAPGTAGDTGAGGDTAGSGGDTGTGGDTGAGGATGTGAGGNATVGAGGTAGTGGNPGSGGQAGSTGEGGSAGSDGSDAGSDTAAGSYTTDAATDTGTIAPPPSPDLGKACNSDADCAGGLTCLTAADRVLYGLEGPAHGYCSLPCDVDAVCTPYGGTCYGFNVSSTEPLIAYCLRNCTVGGPSGPGKCFGRPDVACIPIVRQQPPAPGVCLPMCSGDNECPLGRHCDLQTGQCTDAAPQGDPLGTPCQPDAAGGSNCAGVCLGLSSSTDGTLAAYVCSNPCVLDDDYSFYRPCNGRADDAPLSGGGTHGACALGNGQVGDVGFCVQQCDGNNECSDTTDPGEVCATSPDIAAIFGHGICLF